MPKTLPSFDEMAKMAKENPEALEKLRREMCEQLISEAPMAYQRKLRGLQFKIDMERRRAKTPMASCIKLSQMMHESFTQLRESLNNFQGIPTQSIRKLVKGQNHDNTSTNTEQSTLTQIAKEQRADIIEFPIQ